MDLKGQKGELKFTLQITRAATGKTETVDLIGKIGDNLGDHDGSNTLSSSTECGDRCSDSSDRGVG